jgi:hypothetical protein
MSLPAPTLVPTQEALFLIYNSLANVYKKQDGKQVWEDEGRGRLALSVFFLIENQAVRGRLSLLKE